MRPSHRWKIEDQQVLVLLEAFGFTCYPVSSGCWYMSNIPIPYNGSYQFPSGHLLLSQGESLRLEKRPPTCS